MPHHTGVPWARADCTEWETTDSYKFSYTPSLSQIPLSVTMLDRSKPQRKELVMLISDWSQSTLSSSKPVWVFLLIQPTISLPASNRLSLTTVHALCQPINSSTPSTVNQVHNIISKPAHKTIVSKGGYIKFPYCNPRFPCISPHYWHQRIQNNGNTFTMI